MGTTTDYLANLKVKLDADAAAKKAAYDAALARATQVSFDAQGRPTYAKNEQGQEKYGTLDLGYMNQERTIGAGAEASGMIRSGQTARQYASNLAGDKADVLAAQNTATAGKSEIDAATALETAKYEAMYGAPGSAATGGSAATTPAATPTSAPSITAAPKYAGLAGVGGAAAGAKVTAPGVPVGSNPYSYVPKTGLGATPTPKPKVVVKTPAKTIPKVPPPRRTGPL